MRTFIVSLGVIALLSGSDCQGGAKYKVDDATIADLPASERGEVIAWQADRDLAISERARAQAAALTTDNAIVTAETEKAQARLASQKIASDLDLAKPRRDVALLARLQAELGVAKLAENVAEARLRWCKQGREVNQAQLEASGTHLQLAEARIEQSRAHLAARHGRLPSGDFNVAVYDQQADRALRNHNKQSHSLLLQMQQSTNLEKEYEQRLEQYRQGRAQTPSFMSAYTPPGYTQTGP